jgi:hypothetical protein
MSNKPPPTKHVPNNQDQNRQVKDVSKQAGLTKPQQDKFQRALEQRKETGEKAATYKELKQIVKDVKTK